MLYTTITLRASMGSKTKLSFGPQPTMPEVPKGEHAELKFSDKGDLVWEQKEHDEYGEKYFLPIILFSHPSIESLPKAGSHMLWVSKSYCAQEIYKVVCGNPMSVDELRKEIFGSKWILTRNETGSYRIDQA